jgi:cell division initiation protein
MNTQVEMFNSLEKDFIRNYNIGSTIDDTVKEKEIATKETFDLSEFSDKKFKVKNINTEEMSEDNLTEIKNFFVKGD